MLPLGLPPPLGERGGHPHIFLNKYIKKYTTADFFSAQKEQTPQKENNK